MKNLSIDFISSGCGATCWRVGHYTLNTANFTRLTIKDTETTIGRFCQTKTGLDPDLVKKTYNEHQKNLYNEFLEWCKQRNFDPEEIPRTPELLIVNVF